MWGPLLASAAFGFLKGLTAQRQGQFNAEKDVYAPLREELIYRSGPFWTFGNVPYGSTAAVFAVDHVISDLRIAAQHQRPVTARELIARLGDVALGGWLYESAFRQSGIIGAFAAHAAHNLAVGFGSRARR
jgi:hypothetical protein